MSFHQGRGSLPRRFRLVLLSVMQATGLPFSDVLTEEEIEHVFDEEGCSFAEEEDDTFTPSLTRCGVSLPSDPETGKPIVPFGRLTHYRFAGGVGTETMRL